ncbi:putative reverse transcriptase domain, reverse transcriptase zinc-binding domain protein, partial [Tanacetum coccineum]
VKGRISRSRIDAISMTDGTLFEADQVPVAFVNHYAAFLGQHGEVKDVIFSMGNDKSPGPDGYTAAFYKEAWDIVASDVTRDVQKKFTNSNLLKELNHNIIALIPKVASPSRINDYRPISCCKVLFKCISKIIANRIKGSLAFLISPNQSAFVLGRRISDNILLTQKLMHNYHLDRSPPRCAFKVDIQNAYDTVDWGFLKATLVGFGFHPRLIHWIMECVSTTSFLLSINGAIHGYFKGKRSLRQGDPISPYLFKLIMEVLTLILRRRGRESDSFCFHRYCDKLDIINLCFTDVLFLFAHGDANSAHVIIRALEEFKLGLYVLIRRSSECLKDWKMSFYRDGSCNNQVGYWSMHVYWASVFILPSRILLDIEQLMHGFLWCQGNMRRGKAKVAWEAICLPKHEGGLGIRKLHTFNKALMTSHIWRLISLKESL